MARRAKALIAGVLMSLPAGLAAEAPGYTPGPHNIPFPSGFEREFVHYATVEHEERGIVRFLYVNPDALDAARPGEPLPYGTIVVMADRRALRDASGATLRDGAGRMVTEPRFFVVAVQRKERGWGVGYPPERRNGEWEYASFAPDGTRRNIRLDGCFSCHLQARAAEDYLFVLWDHLQARGR